MVFATGHIGNWDLAGAAFAASGHPVSALVETLSPARWNERVQRTRIAAGVKAIPIESGIRDMLAALRKREGLAVLVDRPMAAEGVPVTFFGRTTRVPGGAATLALRTGSPVVPAALVRDPHGNGFVAHIGPPIVGNGGEKDVEVQAVMQRIMSWLEGIIERYPDQWFMFRQMWPGSDTAAANARTPTVEPRLLSSLTTRLTLRALEMAAAVAGRVPRVGVGEPLSRLAGTVWYASAPAARRAVRDNLRHVLRREPTRRRNSKRVPEWRPQLLGHVCPGAPAA